MSEIAQPAQPRLRFVRPLSGGLRDSTMLYLLVIVLLSGCGLVIGYRP